MALDNRARLDPDQRRAIIISTAERIACERGLACVSPDSVAAAVRDVKTSVGTVRKYFRRRLDLWRAVARVTKDKSVKDQARTLGVLR